MRKVDAIKRRGLNTELPEGRQRRPRGEVAHRRPPGNRGNAAATRGNHLSNATCLANVFFKSGEKCSKFN